MNSYLKSQLELARKHHVLFLDRGLANEMAAEKNIIIEGHVQRPQVCFYLGAATAGDADNLIHLAPETLIDFFLQSDLPLPTFFIIVADSALAAEEAEVRSSLVATFDTIAANRTAPAPSLHEKDERQEYKDAYFLERALAAEVAAHGHRIKLQHPFFTGLQVCYFDGEPRPDDPPNLVGVPLEKALDYFTTTRNRLPTAFIAPSDAPSKLRSLFPQTIAAAASQRRELVAAYRQRVQGFSHMPAMERSLRIFIPANRLTNVMQYAARNVAIAFESLGHEVLFSIEDNEMEQLDDFIQYKLLSEFQPDVIFVINQSNLLGVRLPEQIFNVVWWQDPMPELIGKEKFYNRHRDITFSALKKLDPMLEECGLTKIIRQEFCVDTSVFFDNAETERENKIVFAGSSYIDHLHDKGVGAVSAFDELKAEFEKGMPLTDDLIGEISTRNQVPYDYIFWNILHYVVRDLSVEWLCDASPIPVEVYGRHWELNARVRPYFKGVVPHGEDLANLYRTARYGFVVHPFELNSQRLAEVAASGAIPIVYDCRHSSDKPHWDTEILFYKTRQDLKNSLIAGAGKQAHGIAEHFGYRRFAEKVIHEIGQTIHVSE